MGRAAREKRALWITQVTLLGYTIEKRGDQERYYLYSPDGLSATYNRDRNRHSVQFKFKWQAAEYALLQEGLDPNASTQDTSPAARISRCKGARLSKRRRKLERVASAPESTGASAGRNSGGNEYGHIADATFYALSSSKSYRSK
jgi:hypothetical protein